MGSESAEDPFEDGPRSTSGAATDESLRDLLVGQGWGALEEDIAIIALYYIEIPPLGLLTKRFYQDENPLLYILRGLNLKAKGRRRDRHRMSVFGGTLAINILRLLSGQVHTCSLRTMATGKL
ncbi:MAG: hypothetical protein LN412_02790 [Candidatus Thermoplasmatota archaeon]|nr:hypothetical protein [Candidatus Thermoplasmatota archaeon]